MKSLSHKHRAHGIESVIAQFSAQYAKGSNYGRIAKKYLHFVLESHWTINQQSAQSYWYDKPNTYVSALRAFLKYAEANSIYQVFDDRPPKIKGSPWVLKFLNESQLRASSKITYAAVLQELELFLNKNHLSLQRVGVVRFLEALQEKGASAYTQNLYLSITKQFAKYCITEKDKLKLDEEAVNRLRDILLLKNLKTGKTKKQYAKGSLTKAEREHLMQCIQRPRDKAIIALMVYQGLRTIEVLRLTWKDIQQKEGKFFIAVLGKGRHEKDLIPLLKSTHITLNTYKNSPDYIDDKSMFALRNTSSVRKIVALWYREAGLMREDLSAHSLRHTCAQLMLEDGIPKAFVQRFLRHRSSVSTDVYTARKEDELFLRFDFNQ